MTGAGGRDDDHLEGVGAEPLETAQLSLANPDERLPWLESPDDEFVVDSADNGGLIRLVLVGLVVMAAIVGGIWWATHRTSDSELVADGSLVPAEPGPYKEAPRDPGGKQFDGTGDSSFAVSEGQNRPAQLGGTDSAATPTAAVTPTPAPAATPKPTASGAPAPAAAPAGGTGVQVGAYSSKAAAEAGWTKLVAQSNGALSGVSHRVIEGRADNGTIFRLQAVAGDRAGGAALCSRLKASGIACQVK